MCNCLYGCRHCIYRWCLMEKSKHFLLAFSIDDSEVVPIPDPQHRSVCFCFNHGTVRRLLCQWFQKGLQDQGGCNFGGHQSFAQIPCQHEGLKRPVSIIKVLATFYQHLKEAFQVQYNLKKYFTL